MNRVDALAAGQAVLDPAGPQAAHIAHLWWILLVVCAVVYVLTLAALAWALRTPRRRRATSTTALVAAERRAAGAVTIAVGVTIAVLLTLLVVSFTTGRSLAALGSEHPVVVQVTGHQWWWDVEYQDDTASRRVRTANEIHVPVGEPVLVLGQSNDVIHSFWVPNLHGKMDLIPGHPNRTFIQADRAGVYHGQCAEFCGYQHAHMAFVVVAEPRAAFDAWLAAQRRPAAEPETDVQRSGRETFLAGSCTLCHTVRGTPAGSRTGPDLTHLMSRATLAAGTLPNLRGHLAGWIVDPQAIKPGVRMPTNRLDATALQDLLAYLEHLT